MIGNVNAVFRSIGPSVKFDQRLAEWIKYNGHLPSAEYYIAAYRALHGDLCRIAAGEATAIQYGPLELGYTYDENAVSEALGLGMMDFHELRSVPQPFEHPPMFPLTRPFTPPPHVPTLWAKRMERRETHYLWAGGCEQITLALWLWCDQDTTCFEYAVRTVWAQYALYTRGDCGFAGEDAKLAAALATAAQSYFDSTFGKHPRSAVRHE